MIVLKKTRILSLILILLTSFSLPSAMVNAEESKENQEVDAALKQIFADRAQTLTDQQTERLKDVYLTQQTLSKNAYHNESNRTAYINAWAAKRSVKLVKANSSIRIIRRNVNGDTAKVSLVQSLKLSYVYLNEVIPPQSFGIGTRHFMTLKKINGSWKIAREWYLDPLDENPDTIADSPDGLAPSVKPASAASGKSRYNRSRAVAYADKYAGTAWGAGNHHRYNRKYLDYTGKGGDCTNFASQAVGDPEEGGGLPMKLGWRYFYQTGGTQTWVQTDAFRNFLLRSGYGTMVAKGTYKEIVAPSRKHAHGAISQLQAGDLIGYILKHNDTDHFSVITGFDEYGYPLVNSHTADRYRVPFDLGWDKYTKYELIHIRD
ncbi:amidase domain-containing protein [Paenibacillus agri]|uniref:Amidase domain-containing protein n=1 Tax=Paenibacillus agri TaxID=2744309 RepID=A0A850ERG5_9BACL|nr:amidase domain-containing protein [Paenibacillus agri]NUU63515.1 amidase domain-containing protein [Paenibacillus agri]